MTRGPGQARVHLLSRGYSFPPHRTPRWDGQRPFRACRPKRERGLQACLRLAASLPQRDPPRGGQGSWGWRATGWKDPFAEGRPLLWEAFSSICSHRRATVAGEDRGFRKRTLPAVGSVLIRDPEQTGETARAGPTAAQTPDPGERGCKRETREINADQMSA